MLLFSSLFCFIIYKLWPDWASGLADHDNYHEYCRLLGRFRVNYQVIVVNFWQCVLNLHMIRIQLIVVCACAVCVFMVYLLVNNCKSFYGFPFDDYVCMCAVWLVLIYVVIEYRKQLWSHNYKLVYFSSVDIQSSLYSHVLCMPVCYHIVRSLIVKSNSFCL